MRLLFATAFFALTVASCGPSTNQPAEQGHGRLTEMSRVEGNIIKCDHQVPEQVCTRHHPELEAEYKRAGDWCKPHGVPESQCFKCHPDLTFDPLPELDDDADVKILSKGGEDLTSLDDYLVAGKVTVFEFYADWCASCRKVDGYIYRRIADGDDSIAYRKINIVSWESPVGKHYMKDVPSLPLIVIYGKDGKQSSSMHGAKLEQLELALEKAAQR